MWLRTLGYLAAVFLGALAVVGCDRAPSGQSPVPGPAPVTVYRIGWFASTNPSSAADSGAKDFQQGLRDIGYVEGRNVTIDYRYSTADVDRLSQLAAELVG